MRTRGDLNGLAVDRDDHSRSFTDCAAEEEKIKKREREKQTYNIAIFSTLSKQIRCGW